MALDRHGVFKGGEIRIRFGEIEQGEMLNVIADFCSCSVFGVANSRLWCRLWIYYSCVVEAVASMKRIDIEMRWRGGSWFATNPR